LTQHCFFFPGELFDFSEDLVFNGTAVFIFSGTKIFTSTSTPTLVCKESVVDVEEADAMEASKGGRRRPDSFRSLTKPNTG
jgi:hypothetical protein